MRIVEPQSGEEAAEILRCANEDGAAVIPRGGGTKSDWGNPPARTDVMLSTARLNRMIEHAWADLTVTVEAGCTIAELQRTLGAARAAAGSGSVVAGESHRGRSAFGER